MNNSSPAHSSLSTTAVAGGGGGGSGSNATVSVDDFIFPCDPMSSVERKDEAMSVLKSDLMAALDKEVKSLVEDNWKFEGPRSRIHLISHRERRRRMYPVFWLCIGSPSPRHYLGFACAEHCFAGGHLYRPTEVSKNWNLTPPK